MQDEALRSQLKLHRQGCALAALVVVAMFYAWAVPIVFSGQSFEGRAASDQLNYHEPVIHTFADQWPRPDLSNYYSATTPGYHLLLAWFEVVLHPSRAGLMLLGSVFTSGLIVLLAFQIGLGFRRSFVLLLPVVASMYVFYPGVWLLPDNAGWLGVLAVLALSLRGSMSGWRLIGAGLVLVGLVFVRQIHLWAAGLIWASAWLGDEDTGPCGTDIVGSVRGLLRDMGSRMKRAGLAILITVPAFAVVGYFIWLWGGVVVPRYQAGDHGGYSGWNPATAAFHFSIVGSFTPFFAGFMADGFKSLMASKGLMIGIVFVVLVLTVLPETTYAAEVGRKSGLWNLVRMGPVIGGHTSVVVLVLAPVGGLGLASLLVQIRDRQRWVFAGAFVAFLSAQTMSPQLWQRYHEPFILMMLAVMSAEVVRVQARCGEDPAGTGKWVGVLRWGGPVVLGGVLLALSIGTLMTDRAAVPLKTGDFERSRAYEPLD